MAASVARERAKSRRRPKPAWVRPFKIVFAILTLLVLIVVIIGWLYFYALLGRATEEIRDDKLATLVEQMSVPPSRILSADGKMLYQVSEELRLYVGLEDVPKVVRDAILAAEDKRFYQHNGVDTIAMARIAVTNMKEGRIAQGGSTLTMQLAKRISSKSERTFERKMHDIALAVAMERDWSKDRILELYLNEVYFGANAYGIKAAAKVYFNKDLGKLTLGEAAMLARCVRRPSDQNPFSNLKKSIENRNIVLASMLGEGWITQDEYEKAKSEVPKLNPNPPVTTAKLVGAKHFVSHVLDVIKRQYPDINLKEGGYTIETTLNFELQKLAEKEVKRIVEESRSMKVTTAAFVLIDAEGRILAEVGGVDFDKNQYNVIYQGRRQPGSSFKPLVYATAFDKGVLTPHDTISNDKVTYPAFPKPYSPKNSNNKYGGDVSVRTAFAYSYNIPAVRTAYEVGPSEVVRYAKTYFGITSPLDPYLPLALGASAVNPLEFAQAYSVFMLRGNRFTPFVITRIRNADGSVIAETQPQIIQTGFSPSVCAAVDDLLREVVRSGTGRAAASVPNARGKTGTTSDNRDAWFCGYSDGLLGIGWIANEQRTSSTGPPVYLPMSSRAFGGTITVRFWTSVMKAAHEKYGDRFALKTTDMKDPERPKPTEADREDAQSQTRPNPTERPTPRPMGPPDETYTPTVPATGGGAPSNDPIEPAVDPGREPASDPPRSRPQPTPTPVEPARVEEQIEAEVCVETGLRANIYCPETISRRFAKGKEPRRTCRRHSGR